MKTAIYIEDGIVQIVITPETDFEKSAINTIADKKTSVTIFDGSFYDCRGGWIRQSENFPRHTPFGENNKLDRSLILRVDIPPKPQEA